MTYSMMVRPTLLCVAFVTLLFALLTPTTTASPVSPTPAIAAASSSVFLSAYSFQADGVHTIGYSFDPSTGSTTLLRSEMREVFPTPKDKGSLRRDDTQYLTTINNLLSVHSFAPTDDGAAVDGIADGKKAKILLSDDGEDSIFVPETKSSHIHAAAAGGVIGTNFYGYSLFMNTSTLIQPVPFSVTRLIYDPIYDIVMGVSSVHQADGQWNVTFVMMEYNGDFYSYYIPFMSMLLPNPVGSGVEDACRPEVAYDSHLARMTLHWPGSSSTTGGVTTGQLFTWNITYKNFTPSAKLISTIAWPPSSNNQLSSVFGLAYSADIVGGFAYASGVSGSNGVVVGVVDPLTGDDLIPPVSAQFGDYDRPRMLVTKGPAGVALLVIEYTQPWRFTSIHLDTSNTVTSGVIRFPADKTNNDDDGQVVLGIHNWN